MSIQYQGILLSLVLLMGCSQSPSRSDNWPDIPKTVTTPNPLASIDAEDWERTKQDEAKLWDKINAPRYSPTAHP